MVVTIVDSRGVEKVYTLTTKPADIWGVLRFDIVEQGSDAKPYSISYHPDKYTDSKTKNWGCSCKGWVFHRKCKHITAVAKLALTKI